MTSVLQHTIFMNTNYKFGNSLCEQISPKQRILQWAEPIIDYKDSHLMLAMVWRTNVEVDGIGAIADATFVNSNTGVVLRSFAEQFESSKLKKKLIHIENASGC